MKTQRQPQLYHHVSLGLGPKAALTRILSKSIGSVCLSETDFLPHSLPMHCIFDNEDSPLNKNYHDTCKMKTTYLPVFREMQSEYKFSQTFQSIMISDSQISVLCITLGQVKKASSANKSRNQVEYQAKIKIRNHNNKNRHKKAPTKTPHTQKQWLKKKYLFNQHEERQPWRADRLQSRLPALCFDLTDDRNDNYDTTVSLQTWQARVSDFKTDFSRSQDVVKSGSKAGICSIYFEDSSLQK